ncbi:putative mitochondrial-processing peptidase subunit beta, mitochondrial [Carex rostrata]
MSTGNLLRLARHCAARMIPANPAAHPRFLGYTSPFPPLVDHMSIHAVPKTRVTTLPNGLRVVTFTTVDIRMATVGVWIDAGSRFETQVPNGTAHFVERMAFWGTPIYTVDELKRKMENINGHFISSTSREQTSYYAKVCYSNVSAALDILADFLQNTTFNPSNFMLEKEAILCKIKEVEGQPENVIFNHLHAIAFQNTPLSRTILGSAENVKSITQDHLKNYKTTQYTASRVVISAAGPVEHRDVVNLVKKLFTKLSSDPTTASQLVAKSPTSFTGSEVRIIDDDMKLAQFAVAFEGAAVTDPDSIALMVMQAMLGCGSKQAMLGCGNKRRGEILSNVAINDIAESVMAFNTNYKDTGLFGVYAVAKPDCLDALSYEIMQSISKLCYSVTDDDVTRARMEVKSSHRKHRDSVISIAKDMGRQMLNYGRIIPAAEIYAKIDAVDASAVKRVARRFIFDQDVAIVAIGPVQGLPNYNWFREFASNKISQNLC